MTQDERRVFVRNVIDHMIIIVGEDDAVENIIERWETDCEEAFDRGVAAGQAAV